MSSSFLRILTVANTSCNPNSGAAGTVYHTNQAFRDLGHEVDEIWAEDLGARRISHGNLHSLLEQPRAYRHAVTKAVKAKQYDLIILDQPQAYLACKALKQAQFSGVILNRSHGVELRVNQVLPQWHRKYQAPESRYPALITYTLRRLLERQWTEVIKYCDGVIVSSSLDQEFLINYLKVKENKICLTPQGVSNEWLNQPPSSEYDNFSKRWQNLLYVGQFAFYKGYFVLSEVVNRILLDHPTVKFTWVASAEDHSKIRELLVPEILDRVRVLDWMPQSELQVVYRQHGIFIFPSFYEGFGKAPLEAMACGLCVVASDEGGMHDYIKHGQNAYLCPVGDSEKFVKVITNLLANIKEMEKISLEAKQTTRDFTWQVYGSDIINMTKLVI